MQQHIRVPLLLVSAVVFLVGCTAYQAKSTDSGRILNTMKDTVTVKPAGSYEECFTLGKNQVMVYNFSSTRPVGFNIHYHGVDGIHYPVLENEITQYNGIFDPQRIGLNLEEQDNFCLMWENQEMGQLSISYECEVKEK